MGDIPLHGLGDLILGHAVPMELVLFSQNGWPIPKDKIAKITATDLVAVAEQRCLVHAATISAIISHA
jgi:hypothetical protein